MQIHVIVIQISIQRAFVTERGFKRVKRVPSNPGKRVRASRIYFGITSDWLRERHEWFF